MVMATVDAVTPFLRIYLKEMVADMDRGTHGRMLPETSALKPKTKGRAKILISSERPQNSSRAQ